MSAARALAARSSEYSEDPAALQHSARHAMEKGFKHGVELGRLSIELIAHITSEYLLELWITFH